MNPTTPQPNNQVSSPQDPTQKANTAKASLAFATHLQTQMMQHQAPQKPPTSSETAPQQEEQPKDDMKAEFDSFKTDITKQIEEMKKGIAEEIKADIATALQDDQPQTQ